jgi:hypothetical protein
MLMHGVYSDALCIHTPSKMDPAFADVCDEESVGNASFLSSLSDVKEDDPRKNLNDTWLKWTKFQPLWKIRNYFGEQIALYFAWLGKHAYFLTIEYFSIEIESECWMFSQLHIRLIVKIRNDIQPASSTNTFIHSRILPLNL